MHLNIDDSKLIDAPNRADVVTAIEGLTETQYVILSREDHYYVQTRRNEDNTWTLEYRDGSADKHFATEDKKTSTADVQLAFMAFLAEKPLAELLDWNRIDVEATEPDEDEVEYNGVIMDADWPAEIEAAQEIKTISISDSMFNRVPFGKEQKVATKGMPHCGDCGVIPGQLHVQDCEIEECPKCCEQLHSCDCLYT